MKKFILITLVAFLVIGNSYSGQLREYWVTAEMVEWNYAPTGKNLIMPDKGLGVWGNHLKYQKYRYIEYTDASYSKRVTQPQWIGILGPQFRAEQGDTLKIHFLNKADKPLSIHPHGMRYTKKYEGADMTGKGSAVKPGGNFTYIWQVDADAAPGPNDPSSIVWVYHSHVDSVTEIYDGLIGTIVITKKGMARSKTDPRPKDIDVAFTNMYMIFNENGRKKIGPVKTVNAEDNEEGNLKHAINGYIFGNLRGLIVKKGDRVRWHLIGMGTEVDIHTAHWHGKTVLSGGHRTDVVDLLPNSMKSADMVANNLGTWLYHCHVTDHITAGMVTRYTIRK
ncbi:Multicopper oxidase [hydrothermal vent metagenome]|uniref:Multicopper oxidase n=1 Tax=hydrothermal vent metagenome TaxID=652676 RepID=A0A3B1A9U6_9ZZZZ